MPMQQSGSLTPQPFHCPNCGASLPDPDNPSIRCDYCGSKILVPSEYMPAQPEPVIIMIDTPSPADQQSSQRPVRRTALFVVLMIIAVGAALTFLTIAGITFTTRKAFDSALVFTTARATLEIIQDITPTSPSPTSTATSIPFATVLLQFGTPGSGPGQFDDPRQITVDLQQNIYVADYDTGRIQKFAPNGALLQLWQTTPTDNGINYISDLAVDSQGRAYAARGGDILIYADNFQEPINTFPGSFPNTDYHALAIDPANYIYSLARSMSGEVLIKLDQNGQELLRKPDIIYEVNRSTPAENNTIAVDGLGNTYFLSTFETQVYKYDAQGVYTDRFGSSGKQPGQFFNPNKLAVDGQDRVYVLDNDYIHVFDRNGVFLDAFEWDYKLGSPRDIAIDSDGNVYIVTSQARVLKFLLNW